MVTVATIACTISHEVIILRSIAHSGPGGIPIQSEKLVVSLKRFTL